MAGGDIFSIRKGGEVPARVVCTPELPYRNPKARMFMLYVAVLSPTVVSNSLRPINGRPPGSSIHEILQEY